MNSNIIQDLWPLSRVPTFSNSAPSCDVGSDDSLTPHTPVLTPSPERNLELKRFVSKFCVLRPVIYTPRPNTHSVKYCDRTVD